MVVHTFNHSTQEASYLSGRKIVTKLNLTGSCEKAHKSGPVGQEDLLSSTVRVNGCFVSDTWKTGWDVAHLLVCLLNVHEVSTTQTGSF